MEIRTDVIENLAELNEEQKKKLAEKIGSLFTKWDEDRDAQIDTAKEIMEEVYLNQPTRNYEGELEWKSDVRLNGLYNIKRAKKSVLWREIWSNPAQMFDVRGTNEQTEEMAKKQKANIVDSLNKMNVGKQLDMATDDLFDIGEMILKTDWVQKKKIVKRQKKGVGFQLMNVMRNMVGAGYMQAPLTDVEIPVYENARVEAISPFMFVFDHTKLKLHNKESWDSVIKIYKRFDSLDNIKANKIYKLTDEQIEELKGLSQDDKTSENKELVELRDKDEYGGQYAILYAHGDFKIDGKTYKNYIAEVVAGKFLVRFEENPMYINPFIMGAIEYDPITKRGISPLKASMTMIKEEERLTNVAFDVQKLSANPPCYAPEDLFDEENTNKDGTVTIAPGKMIKFKQGYNGGTPIPVTISSSGISDLLGLLGQKISDISSVNANMFGNVTSSQRTATELSLADKGATAQSGKELDTIYQDITIPMVENVAELLAMFADGVDYVYAQEKGNSVEYKITNEIRQGEYQYIYEDRNAIADRKNKVDQLFQLFNAIGQSEELSSMIDWKETITTYVECIGFDNPEKFFSEPDEIDQMAEQFKQMPDEVKQQLLPQFQQQAQQTMQQYQQMMQQQQMQQQANNQVQMDMYRQQARANAEQELLQQQGVM